jgi:aspartyl-tRNA(Asn)/glutamyl-tRNA(Gln) amidotransferase subunit A
VPCGETKEKLPIGLQILGKHFDEAAILRVAHSYEKAVQ